MRDTPADPPWLTVVGGPNGVGKSTFLAGLQTTGYPVGHVLNPDDIAQTLSGVGQASAGFVSGLTQKRAVCVLPAPGFVRRFCVHKLVLLEPTFCIDWYCQKE